jgi:hypothetical protein
MWPYMPRVRPENTRAIVLRHSGIRVGEIIGIELGEQASGLGRSPSSYAASTSQITSGVRTGGSATRPV